MEPSFETPYSSRRESGATWEDVFLQAGGYDSEEGDKLLAAARGMVDRFSEIPVAKKVNTDILGMVEARRRDRLDGMMAGLESLGGDSQALAPVRETFAKSKNENLRKAAEDILYSEDTPDNKRKRLQGLGKAINKPQDDVTDYAHESVQSNPKIAPQRAAERAEAAANYVNNTPIGMIKRATKVWEDSSTDLAVTQSILIPSSLRMYRVLRSSGFGDKDVRYSQTFSVDDNLRAFDSAYEAAGPSERKEMVSRAIASIEKEARGDKWFAMDALDRIFGVITAYNDSGDYRKAEEATHRRSLKTLGADVLEIGGGIADVGSLATIVKAWAGAAKAGVGAVQAIKAAEGLTTGEAVEVLKVGYGVKKSAEAAAKRRVEEAAKASAQASKAAETSNFEPGTAASIDAIVNPERLAAKMLESFDNPEAAIKYGVDQATALARGVLPRAADEALVDTPYIGAKLGISKVYDEVISKAMSGMNRVLGGANHFFMRTAELANVVERSEEEIVTAFKDAKFGVVDLNKIQQVIVDNGYLTQYVVTGKSKSFTAEEAFEAAQIYNTEFDDVVRLLRKDQDTGQWKAVPTPKVSFDQQGNLKMAKQPGGEYAIGLVRRSVYTAADADGAALVREGHLGSMATQVDKSTQFAKDIADKSTWSEKQRGALEAVLSESMKAFDSLGGGNIWRKKKSQAKVMKVLNSGAGSAGKPGSFYDSEKLIEMGLDAQEISAYYSIRARFDAEYFLNNLKACEDMVREGFSREVTLNGARLFMKPVDETAVANSKFVLNNKGEVVSFVKDEYINGEDFQVFRLRNPVNSGGTQVRHMVVRASDQWPEGAAYGRLGDNVLPYHEGYVPRLYEARYIVSKMGKAMDETGAIVDFEKAIATAKNYRHAVQFAEANGLSESSVRLAREAMQPGRGIFDGAGKKRSFNGIIFGRRGTQLEDAEVGHLDDLPIIDSDRNLKSLSEVLSSSSALTSYRQTTEEVISKHIDRWNKAYGSGSEYKWSLATIKSAKESVNPAHSEKYAEATAFRDHIAMLQGTDETMMNTFMNTFRAKLANSAAKGAIRRWLPESWADNLEDVYRNEMGRDMASRIKNVNFTLFMGLNPLSQLLLQSSQVLAYVGLKGGAKYAASGQYTRDLTTLMSGLKFRDSTDPVGKAAYAAALKASGKKPAEFEAFLDAFERSGVLQGIDRHQYLDAVVMHSYAAGSDITGGIGFYAGKFVDASRKIGFNAGETINQTSAWLFARQRMLANDPKLTATMLDTDPTLRKNVVVMGTNIGGNMDNSARLRHQDGLLGVVLQFTSYGTKTTQMLMPRTIRTGSDGLNDLYFKALGRFGSDVYTAREKLFISLTQLGFFGTMGAGVGAISGGVELPGTDLKPGAIGHWLTETWLEDRDLSGNEYPAFVKDAITQGFLGAIGNQAFTALYGERTASDWASRFAPIGNLKSAPGRMFEIVSSIAQQDYSSVANFLSGPTTTQFQKYGALATAVGNMATRAVVSLATGYQKPETVSDRVVFFDKLAQLAPALNNWQHGDYAERTGFFRTADGSRIVEADGGEAVLRKLLGLRPVEELALSAAKNKMSGHYGEDGYGDAEGLKKLADSLWKEMKVQQAHLSDGTMTYEEFEDRTAWLTTMRVIALNDVERFRIHELLSKKYLDDSLETRDKSFVMEFAKRMDTADLSLSSARRQLMTMPDFEGKEVLLQKLQYEEAEMANRYGEE